MFKGWFFMADQRTNLKINVSRFIDITIRFHKLWYQHVMWTRAYIVSTSAAIEDLEFITSRIYQNKNEFIRELQKILWI